ncbi:hypothetical protein PtA15_13A361 [Puccinia triticina]|uniref:Uncharacterized protein n=1 Tax=Puccinia triticina TaxID=208348 RepID=A0ABY7D0K3_9BASI|nr:uncharacterized protein PtA15_13A361 [Puccinia triticina]WAQ90961.1 hypothetical protein PtA15_13A361 [Puccinia triticina]
MLIVPASFGLDALLAGLPLLREPRLGKQLLERISIGHAPGSAAARQPPVGSHHRPFRFTAPARGSRPKIAAVIWSCGASGKRKGAMCSHHAMLHLIVSFWHQKLDLRYTGLQTIVLFSISTGSSSLAEEIAERRITSLQIAPPSAAFLAKSPLLDDARHDLSRSGGAPVAPDIVETVKEVRLARVTGYQKLAMWLTNSAQRRLVTFCPNRVR